MTTNAKARPRGAGDRRQLAEGPSNALRAWAPPVATIAMALAVWEGLTFTGVLPQTVFPSMVDTLAALAEMAFGSELWTLTGETLLSWSLGLAIAALIAVPLGIILGSVPFLDRSLSLPIEFLRPLPPVALIPLSLLLWGPSLTMKLFLITFGAVWPILVQVLSGVRSVDPLALEMARSYQLGRWRTGSRVVLLSVMPFIMTGVRIAASMALIISIVAELVGGTPGLGQALGVSQTSGALAKTYAYIIYMGILGYTINVAFSWANRLLLPWHVSMRVSG